MVDNRSTSGENEIAKAAGGILGRRELRAFLRAQRAAENFFRFYPEQSPLRDIRAARFECPVGRHWVHRNRQTAELSKKTRGGSSGPARDSAKLNKLALEGPPIPNGMLLALLTA